VVADIAKLSVGREAYYTRELASDHEQYLSGHGESPGRWRTSAPVDSSSSPSARSSVPTCAATPTRPTWSL
jgi:hypothetical protein